MTRLIVIRPEPGCSATVAAARALGLAAEGWPLFTVEPKDWELPDPAHFDALLIGSANALRHGGPGLAALAALPAYCVGAATAEAARAAGFAVAATGQGGLQPMLGQLAPTHRRLLRLAGRERVELTLPPGVSLTECVVYASNPQPLPAQLEPEGAVVALHSAEAARHFAAECDHAGLSRACIALATIGPRVTAAAGSGWASVVTADSADDAALLAQARALCQDAGQ